MSVPDESRVEGLVISRNGDDLDPGLWNRAVPVDGGSYVIEARAPAHEAWSTTVEIAAEAASATVDVPQFKQLVEVPEEEIAVAAPPPAPVFVDAAPPGPFTPRRKLAVGIGVAGVLAIAAGGALGWTAKGLQEDYQTLCPSDPCDDADAANAVGARAETRALYANVAFGVGAAAIIGAAVLWLTGAPAAATIVPTSDGLAVAGRF